jgi:hypothetical protein
MNSRVDFGHFKGFLGIHIDKYKNRKKKVF